MVRWGEPSWKRSSAGPGRLTRPSVWKRTVIGGPQLRSHHSYDRPFAGREPRKPIGVFGPQNVLGPTSLKELHTWRRSSRVRRPSTAGADDATGIAGSFSAGIESSHSGALSGLRVADDADGGAAARFGAGQGRITQESAAEPPIDSGSPVIRASTDRVGQKARGDRSCVAPRRQLVGIVPRLGRPFRKSWAH